MVMVNLNLTEEEILMLDEASKKDRRSRSSFIAKVVTEKSKEVNQ